MSSSAVAQPNPGISLPDDKTGHQIQVVYVETDSAEGSNYHKNGQIIEWVNQLQAWLKQQTGKDFIFDTHKGELDIPYFKIDGNVTKEGNQRQLLIEKYRELNPDTYFGKTLAFIVDQTKRPSKELRICGFAGYFSDYGFTFPNIESSEGNCNSEYFKKVNPGFSGPAKTLLHEIIHSYGVEHICVDSTDLMIGDPECPEVGIERDSDKPVTFDLTGTQYYGGFKDYVDLNTLKIWSDGSGQFTPFLNQGNCALTEVCNFLYNIVDMSWAGKWQLEIIVFGVLCWIWVMWAIFTTKDGSTKLRLKEVPKDFWNYVFATVCVLGFFWILLIVEPRIFN